MPELPFGATAADFGWCTGIEDTFVPQTRNSMRPLDEYELMGHYERWREDLQLARDAGARMIRWGIPWYRVEPEQGHFDWSWVDQVLPYMIHELGLTPIIDLVHYGTPSWLSRSFVDPGYPEAVAAYARGVAERYGHLLRYYTPLNEPIISSIMCGMRGVWPPYLRGERGFVSVGLAMAKGIVRTVRAIKEVDPSAVMVHVEAAGLTRAAQEELEPLADERRRRDFLFLDLVTGRVTAQHPLFSWLLMRGVSLNDLRFLNQHAIELDVVGLNFYPQWSTRQLTTNRNGRLHYRLADREGEGFAEMIASFFERYQTPIMITETSAKGELRIKRRWLDASVVAVRDLRSRGIPVIGYTWFPLFTMIDWRYRTGRGHRNDYLMELGLYHGKVVDDGSIEYVATELVERFRSYARDSAAAVGELLSADMSAPLEAAIHV
ncbi:MAG: GH1 [uncultured Chloroflexia bacterium]|uniref:GH1 n=1 Tax=uncultured Chloroflexia bacterium TaxID=1672391 RepID=A0A6J4J984_9CHLR|nr:MAG: GH1 [uncultured Chloroflexia bacterium]